VGRVFDMDTASMHTVETAVIYFLEEKKCTVSGVHIYIRVYTLFVTAFMQFSSFSVGIYYNNHADN
jgi:hypothetical protein